MDVGLPSQLFVVVRIEEGQASSAASALAPPSLGGLYGFTVVAVRCFCQCIWLRPLFRRRNIGGDFVLLKREALFRRL